jgi:Transposase DDE domain
MLDQIVVIYCICDEVACALNIKDDIQCKMSTPEVMTFTIISAMTYGCNYFITRLVAYHHKYFPKILSHSQLIRRIHQIPEMVWYMVFLALQLLLRNKNNNNHFIIDSFPVKAYENHKSFRAKIFSGKKFHGYTASKKQYFFGIKVHMIVDSEGIPIEFSFTPGKDSDIRSLQDFSLNLPKNSLLIGDKAYNDYGLEDYLKEFENITLLVKRRKNQKRQNTLEENVILLERNIIETVFSSITSRMPRYIKAKTEKDFV